MRITSHPATYSSCVSLAFPTAAPLPAATTIAAPPDVRWRALERPLLGRPQQLIRPDPERLGNLGYNGHRRIAHAPLDPADVGPVQFRLKRQLLLRKAASLPQAPDVEADLLPDIHLPEQTAM